MSLAKSVEMLHTSPTICLGVVAGVTDPSIATAVTAEASINTNEIGWRCAKTIPFEPSEKVTVRPVGSPSAITLFNDVLPLTGFVDNVVLLLLLLFENKEFSDPTVVVRPSTLLAAGRLPSLPASKPDAVSSVVVAAVVVGDIQSSSQIFTTTSVDTPDPLLLDDE